MSDRRRPVGQSTPRFSVVIPTFERRDLAVRCVRSLAEQGYQDDYEIIVVVDGSTDGSADALRGLSFHCPLSVIEQANQGASVARNRGAAASRGELLLFLDDDMEADAKMLAEHDRSHQEGAEVVLGHLPLHPDSPDTVISRGVGRWAAGRCERLTSPGAELTLHDLLTGQISISRALFEEVGGFDTDFTRDGGFGNEDVDFGYRLMQKGCQIVFNAQAISWQNYVVRPQAFLKQWYQAGMADVLFARKHPDRALELFELNGAQWWSNRFFWRPLQALPAMAKLITLPLRWAVIWMIEKGWTNRWAAKAFLQARSAAYWRGVYEAGGIPHQPLIRVLVYHAIQDLKGLAVVEPYGVSGNLFRLQLEILAEAGFRFITGNQFLSFLRHETELPDRAILLTFDDCYTDLLHTAVPVLRERRIPAIAFAVSGLIGDTNMWDQAIGAPSLALLNKEGLHELARSGIDIGAHSRTHPILTRIGPVELVQETSEAVNEIEELGLPRPRFFSYPHGEHSESVREMVSQTGVEAAFTVDPGVVRAGDDSFQISRIEVLREDKIGWRFIWKVATAGRSARINRETIRLLWDLSWASARVRFRSLRKAVTVPSKQQIQEA